jgi:hypothetical protein
VSPEAGADGLEPFAELWATVDLERALREHGHDIREADGAVPDPLLGARVAAISIGDEAIVAFAEPTTEGRLAASLARDGEGPAGRYVALAEGDTLAAFRRRAHAAGVAISRVETGPFGPSVLLLDGPKRGPHVLVVERRSLPSRP